MNLLSTTATATLIVAAIPLSSPLAAPSFDDVPPQKIVISLQADPLKNHEPACVALQLGTAMLKSRVRQSGDTGGDDEVTVFATLDGVGIVNAEVLASRQLLRAPSKFCKTVNPSGQLQDPVPLPRVLDNYLEAGGEILACPLCWVIKFGNLPDSAQDLYQYDGQVYIDSPVKLFLEADKVIDY